MGFEDMSRDQPQNDPKIIFHVASPAPSYQVEVFPSVFDDYM